MQNELTLDKNAVSRAVKAPLAEYYKQLGGTQYDGSFERPGRWDEDEALFNSIYKSKYVSKHLDWLYVLELIFSVLDGNPPLTATDFAIKLEELVISTASHRDCLAIFPLSFIPAIASFLPRNQKSLLEKKVVGKFTISPSVSSTAELNDITAGHGFPDITESDFLHAMLTSKKALSRSMVVTFEIHGAEDHSRWKAQVEFTHFRRMLEVFGVIFGDKQPSFAPAPAVDHFFLLNKSTRELRRLPTKIPSTVDLALSMELLEAIDRSEFNAFLEKISSSTESMYDRLRNAVKFFSLALNAEDVLAPTGN